MKTFFLIIKKVLLNSVKIDISLLVLSIHTTGKCITLQTRYFEPSPAVVDRSSFVIYFVVLHAKRSVTFYVFIAMFLRKTTELRDTEKSTVPPTNSLLLLYWILPLASTSLLCAKLGERFNSKAILKLRQ